MKISFIAVIIIVVIVIDVIMMRVQRDTNTKSLGAATGASLTGTVRDNPLTKVNECKVGYLAQY